MSRSRKWETESLEWIHKVRQDIDEEVREKGLSIAQWIRERSPVNTKELCKSLKLNNVKPAKKEKRIIL